MSRAAARVSRRRRRSPGSNATARHSGTPTPTKIVQTHALYIAPPAHPHPPRGAAGHAAPRGLELVRIEVAPGADDDVLVAAGDEHLAPDGVGAVSRVEPFATPQAAGRLGIAEVAAGGRRPAEVPASLLAVPDLAAGGVHDAQLVARPPHAAADEAEPARLPLFLRPLRARGRLH